MDVVKPFAVRRCRDVALQRLSVTRTKKRNRGFMCFENLDSATLHRCHALSLLMFTASYEGKTHRNLPTP